MAESLPPPPPKHGGSGGFIAAAIVMLLLMGGLIYWKVSGNKPPPPPPPPPKVAQKAPVLDEPPPPPPPASALVEAGPKKVAHHGTWHGGGCSGECTGKATGALRAALRGRAGQARGCYEHALRTNSTLKGRMVVNVRLGPQGQVCSASVASNGLGNVAVANCVVEMFRTGKYPAPQGGCVDTAVPMNFVPKS